MVNLAMLESSSWFSTTSPLVATAQAETKEQTPGTLKLTERRKWQPTKGSKTYNLKGTITKCLN